MPFERILLSVRRWLQIIHGKQQPMYLLVHGNPDTVLYIEAEMDVTGDYMVAQRWVRNPARATIFTEQQKVAITMHNKLPEDVRWLGIVEVPLYGKPS